MWHNYEQLQQTLLTNLMELGEDWLEYYARLERIGYALSQADAHLYVTNSIGTRVTIRNQRELITFAKRWTVCDIMYEHDGLFYGGADTKWDGNAFQIGSGNELDEWVCDVPANAGVPLHIQIRIAQEKRWREAGFERDEHGEWVWDV